MRESTNTAASAQENAASRTVKISARVYGVMALTTALTFTTLTAGYQLLFPPHSLFA